MRRATEKEGARPQDTMTNQDADETAEAARAAAEGRGRVQGLCGKRVPESEKAEGEERGKKRDGEDVCECAVIRAAGTVRAGYRFYSRTGPRQNPPRSLPLSSSSPLNNPPRCLAEERYASSAKRPGKRARGCRPGSERSWRGGKRRAAGPEEPVPRRRVPAVRARSGLTAS